MNRLLFAVLLLMCGTAWGQDYFRDSNGNRLHVVYVQEDSILVPHYDINDTLFTMQELAARDSLRLIRQVDIVLGYLKSKGYELPRAMLVRGDSEYIIIKSSDLDWYKRILR